jgi:mannose-1-phosphate guanylyltransferase
MNIVIMAGGGGTRLWPLSRRSNPKQFLNLGSGKTLIEHTYDRAKMLADPADIFVATSLDYQKRIRQLLPAVPADNIFLEPAKRDTGPAFAAAAVQLKIRQRAEEPTVFMWSDHVFTAEEKFMAALKRIPRLVSQHPQAIIVMGHQATFPETALGYLEAGEQVSGENDVFRVKAFKEKPNRATAERYVAAGNFYWNMAYISTSPMYLLDQLRAFEPELMRGIDRYEESIRAGDAAAAAAVYEKLPKIAIDYALLEQAPNIMAVTGDWGWSDVGYWSTVREIFGARGDHAPTGHHLHVNSDGCYVYNATDQAVTLIGLKDIIVVVTPDAILVTDKHQSDKIKEVVAKLEEGGKAELL